MAYLILTLSILLQFLAAGLALRLTAATDRFRIWAPIAGAICLMALRRCLVLYEWLAYGPPLKPLDLPAELTSLITSALMVIGVYMITPILRSAQRSFETLKIQHESILNSAGEGIFGLDREGKTIFANPAALELTGYSEDELIGKNIHNLIHHTRMDGTTCPFEECPTYLALNDGKIHRATEAVFWSKEGKSFPVRYVTTPIKENSQIRGCVVLFRDITERKESEVRLRESEQDLRYLAAQLIDAQERERERISRELHDELGQALLVLKLQAGAIQEKIDKNPTVAGAECREMSANLDRLVENVRRLSRDLSPAVLQDLGLTGALRHLVNEFAKRQNLQAKLDLPLDLDGLFPQEAQINIYRIFQESLTNIGKYAQASSLTMAVNQNNGWISFRLADDGQGFDVEKVQARESTRRGLGLAAMEERGRMLGGKVDIKSQPGEGTEIILSVPMRNGDEAAS
ncbi:MAG: PAS domain S-box protein [Desulfobaccales bacterium]